MGRDQSGRGGLSPAVFHQALKLVEQTERLTAAVIGVRSGIHPKTVQRIRRACRVLARVPSLTADELSRRTKLGKKTCRLLVKTRAGK